MSWYWWILIYLLVGCFNAAIAINIMTNKQNIDDILDELDKDDSHLVVSVIFVWPIYVSLFLFYLLIRCTKGISNKLKNL